MYKLLNYLFGWDYIHWKNSADQGISRIRLDGQGLPYYWRYGSARVLDIIATPISVTWLTCEPSKYAPPAKENNNELQS
jgi:hypothetical protein